MDQLLDQCQWPQLANPYQQALREAVEFILQRFEVLGIVASGTIIRGNPHPASDLDLSVIHAQQRRQRIQRFFNGVPCEIFVNPVHMIERYLREEQRDGRPVTAHMLNTGFVVLERSPVVEDLRQRALRSLEATPDPTEQRLLAKRYGLATQYEDAVDVAPSSPATADLILGAAVLGMVRYHFLANNGYVPRDKDLLQALGVSDPDLALLLPEFGAASDIGRRLEIGGAIADRTIGARGFFEWESPPEECGGEETGQR